ncbi:MAG: hypothetical protein ACF8PG_09365 [Maioricimonas sp. JB045]
MNVFPNWLQHASAAIAVTFAAVVCCGPVLAGSSNSLMDISTDGELLACTNRDSGSVTIVDLATHTVLHEIPVGHHPEGVSFIGSSHQLAVAVHGDDRIEFVDADSGKANGRIDVFDEPYGVVSTADGSRLYVTLDYPGQVLEVDPERQTITRTLDVGRFVRGLALEPGGQRLLTTEYYTAIVRAIDLDTWEVVDKWAGSSQENLSRQIAVHPTRPKAYLPMQRSRVTVPHGSGAIFPYVAIVDTEAGEGKRRKRVQMDSFRGTYVVANPWEVAISPDGSRLYVVFAGTDDMFVCNVLDDNYREIEYDGLLRLGANPRAVRVAPDGATFYVYNALDFNVVAYDASPLQERARVTVCDNPLEGDLWLGKRLFYSARQPMVGRRWISCSSCHPDGEPDGRTWQQPEGLRQTQPLFGMAHTHPIHWSADRDEVQDFEHTIRGPLMQGRGLIRGKLNDSLGEPNKGLSRELDALAAYANSHDVPLSPYAKNGLSEAAQRGRALFFSEETKCATCHSGRYYSDSGAMTDSGSGQTFLLHDVGTGRDDPSEKMGTAYDTPTLLGVYRSAPYLHDGSAATLRDVLTTANPEDRHGSTSHLSEQEIDDLVEFLKALPYEQ